MFQENLLYFVNNSIVPLMTKYDIEYSSFENGDLGSLNRIEFNNKSSGGVIELWSSGWVGIHFVDYVQENEMINVLIGPEEMENAISYFDILSKFLS